VDFELRGDDADYLLHRIVDRCPRSLLAHLLLSKYEIGDEEFAWQMPRSDLNGELADQLLHAQNFSETLHGAALLYNLILAEQKPNADWVEFYREQLQLWWEKLNTRANEIAEWNREAFWTLVKQQGGRVSVPTRSFVDAWLTLTSSARSLDHIIAEQQLVADRESSLKKGRSRIGNRQALCNWNGASGTAQLDYRWNRPVRELVNDIVRVLNAEEGMDA